MGRIPALRYTPGTWANHPLPPVCLRIGPVALCAKCYNFLVSAGDIWYAGREESRQIPRFDLTSHLVLLNVAVEVRLIQQESFPDLNMWNRPVPNQVPYGPNGAR